MKCITPALRFPRPSPLHDRLRDSALNLVVGTLGFQGSGKSMLLSSLASSSSSSLSSSKIFKSQSKKKRLACGHETLGVHTYVSEDRVVFLDSQGILSTSGFLHSKKKNKNLRFDSMYARSLHVTVFMLLVCDVVLVVQDKMFDRDLFRFLHVAEKITRKLMISTTKIVRSCARAVVVSNNISKRQAMMFLSSSRRHVNRNLSDSIMHWRRSGNEDKDNSDEETTPLVCVPKNPTKEDLEELEIAVFSRSEFLRANRKRPPKEADMKNKKKKNVGISERDWFHDARYLWEEIEKVL